MKILLLNTDLMSDNLNSNSNANSLPGFVYKNVLGSLKDSIKSNLLRQHKAILAQK